VKLAEAPAYRCTVCAGSWDYAEIRYVAACRGLPGPVRRRYGSGGGTTKSA
jgi:hypothetical protein